MTKVAQRVMVLGIDAPIVPRLHKMAMEGKLPTIKRLIDEGVFAPNCLTPVPTITPPNWTSIATGAWPGTHGITDFDAHIPGTDLDLTHKAFDSREVLAEPLWTAAERVGKHSIVMNYPTTWPSQLQDGWLVGGYGTTMNDWRLGVPTLRGERGVDMGSFNVNNLTSDILISTESYPFSTELSLEKAHGWEGLELSPKALEGKATVIARRPKLPVAPVEWLVLVDDSQGKGYDTVILAKSKKKADVLARLHPGEWSANIYDTFETDDGPRKAVFKVKLLELSPDAKQVRLYIPGLCSLSGWAMPESLETEITSEAGLPLGRSGWESFLMEWIDHQTLVETVDWHHVWLGDASVYLLKNKPWDLYFMHVHTPDWMYHTFTTDLDPAVAKNPSLIPQFEDTELKMYQGVDRFLGRLLEVVADDTLLVVTSDHAAKPMGHKFNVQHVLEQAGLLRYLPAQESGVRMVDWSATKATGQRSVHIYVNVKGRDPQGIVEPGEEYERVRDQIIKTLHEYVDPQSGLKPVMLALKNEDARVIGLCGDRVGDVIYVEDPRFGKEHGPFLPTSTFGIGDMHGLFIMKGPGVRQGVTIERTVNLVDIVPTICHLAELPVPAQCEGAILYQALEDPDAQAKELQSLRRNVERLKRMVERPPMC